MKESMFNFFFNGDDDTKLIAYNSRTNALAEIEDENYKKIQGIINKEIKDDELEKNLKLGGFLIDDDLNEFDLLRYETNCSKYQTNSLGITIAPTLGCNFECVYCYEEDHDNHKQMSEEVQNKLIEYIQYQIKTISNLNITWYGGEPLLAFPLIEKLSEKFINLCEENKVNYSASIVTNGYLLNKEIASKFEKLKIFGIQVTIDGSKDIHDSRRFLKGGKPTFDKIFNNLIDIIEIFPHISLRVNIDKENSKSVFEILDLIQSTPLKGKIIPYLGYVENTNDCYNKEACLDYSIFSKLDFDFYMELKNRGMATDMLYKYPQQYRNVCSADITNSFTIDPEGKIYKCWNDIGISNYSVGSIKEGIAINNKLFKYMLYDCTLDKSCTDCKVMPLCMGGCPRKRLDSSNARCTNYKYTLEDYIKKIISSMKKYKNEQLSVANKAK